MRNLDRTAATGDLIGSSQADRQSDYVRARCPLATTGAAMSEKPTRLDRPTYTIRLEPDPHCANPARALARLLKFALRYCDLKCTSAEEVKK
jgi:hypothetical protein